MESAKYLNVHFLGACVFIIIIFTWNNNNYIRDDRNDLCDLVLNKQLLSLSSSSSLWSEEEIMWFIHLPFTGAHETRLVWEIKKGNCNHRSQTHAHTLTHARAHTQRAVALQTTNYLILSFCSANHSTAFLLLLPFPASGESPRCVVPSIYWKLLPPGGQ